VKVLIHKLFFKVIGAAEIYEIRRLRDKAPQLPYTQGSCCDTASTAQALPKGLLRVAAAAYLLTLLKSVKWQELGRWWLC